MPMHQFLRPFRNWALLLCGGLTHLAIAVAAGREAGQIYAELCANCHGANLEGGKGGGLIHRAWKRGHDDASVARSIREGLPDAGMPAFAKSVNAAETAALVAFIRDRVSRQADFIPSTDLPLPDSVQRSEEHTYRFETVAEGLDVPWSLSFLPDGRILVTERAGRLRLIEHGKLRPELIGGLPPVVVKDEAGLMSVVAHPDFARNAWVYLSFSDPGRDGTAMTKVVRAHLRDWQLTELKPIFSLPPAQYQKSHVLFGARLVFAGDYLFFSVGVRGMDVSVAKEAQDLALPNGKIHRVFHDGTIPPDNPFVARPGAFPSIWALGVRNPQGLARDPRDGAIWETEHGPRGGDELNLIGRGKNYGWPLVTHGVNYDGTAISDKTEDAGLESPLVQWTPSIATSEIEFYGGDKFPRWRNQLFLGSLAMQKLLRLVIDGGRVAHTEELFKGHGRVRDIKTGPDGLLYLALELIGKPGRIVRMVPVDSNQQAAEEELGR